MKKALMIPITEANKLGSFMNELQSKPRLSRKFSIEGGAATFKLIPLFDVEYEFYYEIAHKVFEKLIEIEL